MLLRGTFGGDPQEPKEAGSHASTLFHGMRRRVDVGIDVLPFRLRSSMSASYTPVFLSYARAASRPDAQRLYDALGGQAAGLCFLDSSDVESGDRLPETLVDALLDARVVVAFATPGYFQRWYCQLEFGVARMPSLHLAGMGEAERARALDGLVIALPEHGADAVADWLPPDARVTVWPGQEQTAELAALVRARLGAHPPTYRERLAAFTDPEAVREELRNASRLPRARRGHGVLTVTPPGLSPSIGDAFVGRADELWRIHAALGAGAGAAGLTGSIEAGGGMGKTRLALEYFYRMGPAHYGGGLFWINAHEPPGPQLRRVLDAVDPAALTDAELEARETTLAEEVRRAFRARPAGSPPALFVVDNVPEPEAEGSPAPLQTWCPALGEPGVAVLATSRMRVNAPGSAVLPVPIGVLEPAAALALLAPPAERPRLSEGEWREIAAWVGHLPLALELLRAALHHGAVSPGKLLAQSRAASPAEALDAARDHLRGHVPDESLPGISAALSLSYGLLDTDAQTAARLLAWLAPAPIPSLVVEESPLDVFGPAERSALISRHFVVRPEGSPAEFFGTMHRVAADFLRRSGDPRNDLDQIAYWGLLQMLRGADDRERRARLVRALAEPCRTLVAHVEASGLEGEPLQDTVRFGAELFAAAHDQGQLATARALGDRLLPLVKRLFGEDDEETHEFTRRLLAVYGATGDLRRMRDFAAERAGPLARTLGESHPEVAGVALLEALALVQEGRYDQAEARMREMVATLPEAAPGPEDLAFVARAFLAYMPSLRGRAMEAIPPLEALLEETERVDLPESGDALTVRIFLELSRAQADLPMSSLADVQSMAEEARETFGQHHPLTGSAEMLLELAAFGPAGEPRTVEEMRVLLARLHEDYGPEHFLVYSTARKLSRLLEAAGDPEGALANERAVVESRRQLRGENSLDALNATFQLGAMLCRLGSVQEAVATQRDVLARMEAQFGEEHPDTIDAMKALVRTLRVARDRAAAQGLQERVLALYERTLGELHPLTFEAALDVWDAADTRELVRAYQLTRQWTQMLTVVHPDLLSPELLALQKRWDRMQPLPGFYRRWLRNRSLKFATEQPPPRKPRWKFW